ncbi:hypothetical protein Vafri_9907 [Volvox africanus]|uniref:Uncharacterized protein n=1 Tax=Volvox africanus TaxID=51714 RepID=A0A8J4B9T9_9CHLO|nr:hypothetical protein Vafri_9907 [Volvox africanus]
MSAQTLIRYLPLIPIGCIICMIIGVPIWVHYTVILLHQVEYSLDVLGPSVTAPNLGRVEEAIKGTSSMYMLFACALFGLGLFRKLMSVEHDLSGLNPKHLTIYRAVNATLHFLWWLIMVWVVVLMMGLAVLAILTWVSYHAVQTVLANRSAISPLYSSWKGGPYNVTLTSGEMAAAGGDLVLATMSKNMWPEATACPSTCLNLGLFTFVQADVTTSCICDLDVLALVAEATRTGLDAIPGMLVGIWFMYIFGDFFKTSLACDFINASRDAEGDRRGYNKIVV